MQPSGLVVEDALGRTVTFESIPQRIVIAGKANFMLNNAVYLFPQATERVVGLTKARQNQGFLELIEPNADEKLRFTVESSAEEIAAAQPDLVILKSFMEKQIGSTLESLGFPVVYLDLETPEQYRRDIAVLGQIFQDEARAEEVIAFYDERLARIRTRLEENEVAQPDALVLQHDSRGEDVAFEAPPPNWIQTWMLEFSGATPVWESEAAGGWTIVNLEQIAAWDPEHVFIIDYFANVEETVQNIRSAPLWHPLTATQEGNIHAFPKDYYSWDQPDTRWILGVTWVAKQLHPELFADIEMTAEVRDFYGVLYGLDADTVDSTVLPLTQGNLD
jgi:iron complex transport system substrate-binding protein